MNVQLKFEDKGFFMQTIFKPIAVLLIGSAILGGLGLVIAIPLGLIF